MANRIRSFADLIAPVTEEEFFATYHDRRFLHVPAPKPDKFADVMSWDILTDMLNMTSIWSPTSLGVFLDTKAIPVEQYCRQAVDRNNQQSFQPDAEKVISWLRRGASVVANDVDTLWPGTAAAADARDDSPKTTTTSAAAAVASFGEEIAVSTEFCVSNPHFFTTS